MSTTSRQNEQAKLADTSISAQCARLLHALKSRPVNTFEAREQLNVMQPAARVLELKRMGHKIDKRLAPAVDAQGYRHSGIAHYFLIELAGVTA